MNRYSRISFKLGFMVQLFPEYIKDTANLDFNKFKTTTIPMNSMN